MIMTTWVLSIVIAFVLGITYGATAVNMGLDGGDEDDSNTEM